MSDKQTLRRRNRAAARATARTKTVDSIEKEGNSSTSGSSSPTRSNASVSPPSDLPKPMPSYGSLDMLGQAKSVESNPYGQTILNAYLYQQGEQLGFFFGVNGTVRELYYYCIAIQKAILPGLDRGWRILDLFERVFSLFRQFNKNKLLYRNQRKILYFLKIIWYRFPLTVPIWLCLVFPALGYSNPPFCAQITVVLCIRIPILLQFQD